MEDLKNELKKRKVNIPKNAKIKDLKELLNQKILNNQ